MPPHRVTMMQVNQSQCHNDRWGSSKSIPELWAKFKGDDHQGVEHLLLTNVLIARYTFLVN